MMPLSTSCEVAMVITDRDLELFRKLSTYGMLSTKPIGKLVFNAIATATVLRRLRCLEERFYLKRILGLEPAHPCVQQILNPLVLLIF
jgi:hypothetical protein